MNMLINRCFDGKELFEFLKNVDQLFIPTLTQSVENTGLTLEQYADKLSQKATIAYERTPGDEISGMVIGYTSEMPDNWSYITQVAVKKEYQQTGIFRRLFAEYEDYIRRSKIDGIWLTTTSLNFAALKAYERVGFKRMSEEIKPDGFTVVRFEKKIS